MNTTHVPPWVRRLLSNQPTRNDAIGLCTMLLALGALLLAVSPSTALAWLGAAYLAWGGALGLAIRRADRTGGWQQLQAWRRQAQVRAYRRPPRTP